MRIVFFGTPAFAAPALRALAGVSLDIASVVTQPDRPRDRGQRTMPSDVKAAALDLKAPVWQPDRLRTEEAASHLRELRPDLGIVVAYGRILPATLLAIPRLGMINVHASLLPRWRGAAPIHRAVMAGDSETGVTIMRIVEALDAGPMLARLPTPIDPNETSETLERRLAVMGADLLVETVQALARGSVPETAQDEAHVTYASRLERRESSLDWSLGAAEVHNAIRGLQPWPLASAVLHGRRVLLRRSAIHSDRGQEARPGTVLAVEPNALVVATGSGAVSLSDIQAEGRAVMAMSAYLAGHPVSPGESFSRWTPPVTT